MVPEERRKQILTYLEKRKYASVEELARELFVSLPTMRRDLAALEQEGALTRTHGGAAYNMAENFIAPLSLRQKRYLREKQMIGNIAAGLIENGDSLFISSGSTTLEFAKQLDREFHLQVLTNGMTQAQLLSHQSNISVTCPAGQYNYDHDGLFGPEVEDAIDRRYAKYGIFSCDGVDMERGVTVMLDVELFLEKAFRKHCDQLVVLADHSKFNHHFFYKSMEMTDVDILITDQDPGKEWEVFCRENDIELLY